MNAIALSPSGCEAVSAAQSLPTTGLTHRQSVETWTLLPQQIREVSRWARQLDGTWSLVPAVQSDHAGIIRNSHGVPQTEPGAITPLCRLNVHIDTPAHDEAGIIGIGLAASAWASVGGEATTDGRDAVIALVEDACPQIADASLYELFCIAEHELQPARDRVAVRFAVDPEFTRKFAKARTVMTAASCFRSSLATVNSTLDDANYDGISSTTSSRDGGRWP